MNIFSFTKQAAARVWAVFAVISMVLSMVPYTAHAAPPQVVVEQCRNGALATPHDCVDFGGNQDYWVTGNSGSSNSHFVEGESIPYRAVLENLPTGNPITLTILFDISKGSQRAIDYLTSYDRIGEDVFPTSGISGLDGNAVDDTHPLPAPTSVGSPVAGQPTASFDALPANEKVMSIWNGDISSIVYVDQGDFTESDSSATINVTFTPTDETVVLAWGGHIASRLDWGFDGGTPRSAGGISGSPYHTSLINWDFGQLGNKDVSLSAGAVIPPGNLTVIKEVINNNGGQATASDFTIDVTTDIAANPSSFAGSDGTAVSVTTDEDGVSYSVVEQDPSSMGYTVSYSSDCSGTLNPGESKICTITNDDNAPTLTLAKTVVGGPADAADFELTATGPTTISGFGSANSNSVLAFEAGTYTLSEEDNSNLSEGIYSQGSWICEGATVENGNEITIGLGDDVSCTITNTYVPPAKGSITIIKTVINNFGGTASEASFQYFVKSAGDVVTEVFNGVSKLFDPGTYTVSESDLTGTGYQAGAWGGDGCTDGNVNLADQDNVTCTITNSDIAPELTVTKVVNNGTSKNPKDPEDFDLVLTATEINGVDSEVTFQDDGTGTTYTFDAGSYAVTEPNHDGYTVQFSDGCTSAVAGDIAIGETRTCTVTNTYIEPTTAVINFYKEVINDNGGTASSSDFTFDVAGTTSFNGITHAGQIVVGLGDYTVSESGPSGYQLAGYSADCSNGTISVTQSELGETLNCTITNDDIQPKLTVVKTVENDNTYQAGTATSSDFVIEVSGASIATTSFNGSIAGEVLNLNAGSYVVNEPDSGNYAVTYSGACDVDGNVTLAVGDDVTCYVTNNDLDPTTAVVTFNKIVNNNYGGTATPDSFSFEVFDGNSITTYSNGDSDTFTVGTYTVTESSVKGYEFVSNNEFCDGGSFTITQGELGQSFDCDFTNQDIEPKLTVTKIVQGGSATTSDFTLVVDDGSSTTSVISGETNGFVAGDYTISEIFDSALGPYTGVFSGACDFDGTLTLEVGDDVTCVLTNSTFIVTGFKWKDEADTVNNLAPNGIFDTGSGGESRLKGWEIIASSSDEIISTVTGDSGYYALALTPGTWEIMEVMQAGYMQTGVIQNGTPVDGNSCIVVFDEQTQEFESTCDFGNYKIRQPMVTCDMFDANPNRSVRSGSDVTLSWMTTDADEVSIDNGVGEGLFRDGEIVVNPTRDTLYTLTARRYFDIEDELSDNVDLEQEYEEVTCQVFVDVRSGGGGGSSTRVNRNPEPTPEPLVLGEQVSAVPLGAADAGAGGASPVNFGFQGYTWSALLTMASRRNG